MKILVELSYLGCHYHGWQAQKNAPSVQKAVQIQAEKLFRSPVAVTGCSRTDAGVHARQFFCTFDAEAIALFPVEQIPRAMNMLLPADISVKSVRQVPESFHPRYSAKGKEYEYLIYTGKERDPFLENRVWMLPGRKIDAGIMNAAAKKLIGTHDFSSFCASGTKITDKVRTVYDCTVIEQEELIRLRISADGFLYNMVRIIAGTLYEAAVLPFRMDKSSKKAEKADISAVLSGKNRSLAGRTAPPWGLYLNRVFY